MPELRTPSKTSSWLCCYIHRAACSPQSQYSPRLYSWLVPFEAPHRQNSPTPKLTTARLFPQLTGYVLSHAIYNVYFHPLSAFPGPWLSRASRLPHVVSLLRGRSHKYVLEGHRRYGAVVRIAPNELAFADARAWNDIMGHRKPDEPEMGKALHFYRPFDGTPLTIVTETREAHSRLRRALAYGFSERSLKEQQPIIKGYIDLLMKGLRESSQGGTAKVDMVRCEFGLRVGWRSCSKAADCGYIFLAGYDCMAFDIIGDLAFGDSFGSLQAGTLHPWVAMIFQSIKFAAWIAASKQVSWLRPFVLLQAPKDLMKRHVEHKRLTREKTLKRIEIGADRPDFMAGLLAKKQDLNLGLAHLEANADILIKAGSETTATVLSGATFLLGTNPDKLAKLTNEVRSAFKSEDEIDYMSVSKLEYMLACLDETMRLYSPVPIGLPRLTPKGGGTICGHYVPEDVSPQAVARWAVQITDLHSPLADHCFSLPLRGLSQREVFRPARRVPPRALVGRPKVCQ